MADDTGWIYINHRYYWDYFKDPFDDNYTCRQLFVLCESSRQVEMIEPNNQWARVNFDVGGDIGEIVSGRSVNIGEVNLLGIDGTSLITASQMVRLPKDPLNTGNGFIYHVVEEVTCDHDHISKFGTCLFRRVIKFFSDVERTDNEVTGDWEWAGYGSPRGQTYWVVA